VAGKTDKEVDWRGDCLEVLRSWPQVVKENIGADLRRLQEGKKTPGLEAFSRPG
jgi:phage-related protein